MDIVPYLTISFGLECWHGQRHLRVSVSGTGQQEWMRRRKGGFAHWRASLSNWLPFLLRGVLLVSVSHSQTPAPPASVSGALVSKPSHATMPDFSKFLVFKKIHFAGLMVVLLIWWFLSRQMHIHGTSTMEGLVLENSCSDVVTNNTLFLTFRTGLQDAEKDTLRATQLGGPTVLGPQTSAHDDPWGVGKQIIELTLLVGHSLKFLLVIYFLMYIF